MEINLIFDFMKKVKAATLPRQLTLPGVYVDRASVAGASGPRVAPRWDTNNIHTHTYKMLMQFCLQHRGLSMQDAPPPVASGSTRRESSLDGTELDT